MVACSKVPLLAPTGSSITLTSLATALPVNGTDQLIAQVIEASGTPPHSGTEVTFTTSLGTVQPSTADTDDSGRVIVNFNAGTSNGTATITAISGAAAGSTTTSGTTTTSTATNVVKIAVGTAAVGRVSVNANPTLLSSVGGTSLISANVFDINGNALPQAAVSFSTTAGSLDATTVLTNGNGLATTNLRTVVNATVTATVGLSSTATPTTGTTAAATGPTSGTVTVNVSGQPVVSITSPTTTPTAGTDAAFTASVAAATTNGAAIRDVTIDFGDGTTRDLGAATGTAIQLHHVYTSSGTYSVTLTATDSNGNVGVGFTSVFVQPATPLTVLLSAAPASAGAAGTTESFTATAIGLGNAVADNYHWVFGGNQGTADTSSNQQSRTYPLGSGTITVFVTVTTSTGDQATGSTVIVVP